MCFGLRFLVVGFGSWIFVLCVVFCVEGSEFWDLGFVFRVLGFGVWGLGPGV